MQVYPQTMRGEENLETTLSRPSIYTAEKMTSIMRIDHSAESRKIEKPILKAIDSTVTLDSQPYLSH